MKNAQTVIMAPAKQSGDGEGVLSPSGGGVGAAAFPGNTGGRWGHWPGTITGMRGSKRLESLVREAAGGQGSLRALCGESAFA